MYSAVRCAVMIMAMATVLGSTRNFNSAAQSSGSKEAAQPSLTVPFEKKSDLSKALARGAKVYATSCRPCHGGRHGKGSIGRAHPHNEMGHTWHHPDAQLKEWIINGKPGPGSSIMPGFTYLREHDVEAILALIKTWWTDEQRESQADISRRYDQAINKKKKAQRP